MASSVEQFQVVEALDGTVDDLKQFVSENELDREQLSDLLEAEEVHKDRKTAKDFLRKKIDSSDLDTSLEEAEQDLEEIRAAIEQIERIEDVPAPANPEEMSRAEILEAVDGTVEELEDFVKFHQLGREQLQDVLDAEESLKNRKTAKKFLRDRIAEQKLAEDVQETEEDLDNLELDVKELSSDTKVNEAMRDIGEPRERDTGGDLADAMRDIANEDIPEDPGETAEEQGIQEGAGDAGEPTAAGEEEPVEEESSGDEDEEPEGEEPDEEEEETGEDEEDEDELEKKREIADELDVDVSDEELRQIPMEELERLRDEKTEREQLIEKLEGQFDEEMLRKASLEDLRKLEREHSGSSAEEERQEEKDREEMEVEAEEDLQMLMGAVSRDEEEKDSEGIREQLKSLGNVRTRVREIFKRSGSEDKEEKKIRKKKVLQLLDDYQDLETEEAAIKTAHIVKGYLEYKLEIEREMTYGELADELEQRNGKYFDEMQEFFSSMAKDEYADTIDKEKMESVVDTAEKVVKAV